MARRKGDDLEALVVLNRDESSPRYWAGVVGINVRLHRRNLGWSQSQLSVKLREAGWPTTQKLISALESNAKLPGRLGSYVTVSVDRVALLARLLGVSPEILLRDHWQRLTRLNLSLSQTEVNER